MNKKSVNIVNSINKDMFNYIIMVAVWLLASEHDNMTCMRAVSHLMVWWVKPSLFGWNLAQKYGSLVWFS